MIAVVHSIHICYYASMSKDISRKLIIGISSRALFNLDESNHVFEAHGVKAYAKHQIKHEQTPLKPGVAFNLVQKLLHINTLLNTPTENDDTDSEPGLIEVILLSKNSADTGLRIFNSIQSYGLDITRAAFTSGQPPYRYVNAFGAHLFLSYNSDDVRAALENGCAAATLLTPASAQGKISQSTQPAFETEAEPKPQTPTSFSPIKIAFDGDAVLFSDEAERIFQSAGLDEFNQSETQSADTPLPQGPFKPFLAALHRLQKHFPASECPVKTALVTARSAPSHERVIRTLRAWNIRIDEALFLGGLDKAKFLSAFDADIFFDDQHSHCLSASRRVTTAHVPHGVTNETNNS